MKKNKKNELKKFSGNRIYNDEEIDIMNIIATFTLVLASFVIGV